jgi:hypothetical protein
MAELATKLGSSIDIVVRFAAGGLLGGSVLLLASNHARGLVAVVLDCLPASTKPVESLPVWIREHGPTGGQLANLVGTYGSGVGGERLL